MKRTMSFILAALTSIMIICILAVAYRCFPQDKVVLDDNECIFLNGFDIRVNGTERVDYKELPWNLFLNYKDAVTMTTTLTEENVLGAVLFFRTVDTSVTVTLDGVGIYEFGEGTRIFGRAPFRVWHIVELPDDYMGKEVVITQRQLLLPSSIPKTLYPVGLSTKAAALLHYFYPTYGFLLFLAVAMAMVSVGFLIFSLILMKRDKNAIKIFYYFLIYLHISLWGICNNSMITLFISNSYFVYCLHYILHASLMVPILLYFGESYQKKYKRMFHTIILLDLVKLTLLLASEVMTMRMLSENVFVINAVLVVELVILARVVVTECIHSNKENRNIIYGLMFLALLGLYEMIRLYVFQKTKITNALYYGMAVMLTLGAMDAVVNYFKESDSINRLKMQNEEILNLLNIQQDYYHRISNQLHIAKKTAHDLNHYNTIIYGAIQSGNTEILEKLLEKTNEVYKNMQMTLYTECLEINSIINYAAEACAIRDIKFTPAIRQLDSNVNIYDLCIIIGNMVDNAVEAASAVEGERYITFFTNEQNGKLFIGTENSYSGNLNIVKGRVMTTKEDKDNHGLGLLIIEELLKKYNGELWLYGENNVFKALAIIPKEDG